MERINQDEFLGHLIDQYGDLVFSVCYRIVKCYFDAEDLAQETFLAAYSHLSTFDGCNEKAWICRIATNKCLDYLKSASRKVIPTADTYFNDVKCEVQTPEDHMLDADMKQYLYDLCYQLKPPYQKVALEFFYFEKDVCEIAKMSGMKMKTLQTQIYRAKGMLRKLWRKEI